MPDARTRHRDAERLAATVRGRLPRAVIPWLAAVRREMESLTTAALSGDLSDEDFRALVEKTAAALPALMDRMDHDALAGLLEEGMGAAMANGIAARMEDVPRSLRAKAG